MRKYFAAMMVVATAACSRSGNVTGPTLTAPKVGAARVVASAGLDFSDTYLGQVTVTNTDTAAHRFAFYVWDATDIDNQQLKARIEQLIPAGQSAVLTVGFAQTCGTKYQRDVYRDIVNYEGATSESEVRNYFFGAAGSYWQSEVGRCETPTVPPVVVVPPPPTCQDREANNYGGLLPCTYGEGVIVVEDPPVDVVTGPNNIAFCHIEYNVHHGQGRNAPDVTTFVHEQNLNITQQAIDNGHSDPAHHFYDHVGACTGQYAPVIGQQ